MAENIGKVISISGPAVDIQFEESKMPAIYQAVRIVSEGFDVPAPMDVVVEVQAEASRERMAAQPSPPSTRCKWIRFTRPT